MPRPKEIFAIRKLKDQLPALALLRDLISEGLADVEKKGENEQQKLALYGVLTRFQTQVNAQLARINSPQRPAQPAMQPLL